MLWRIWLRGDDGLWMVEECRALPKGVAYARVRRVPIEWMWRADARRILGEIIDHEFARLAA